VTDEPGGGRRRSRPSGVPTIADVAVAAGVSHATVSRVVNGLPTVQPAIAERVREAIADLGYTPSNAARSLSLGVTRTIGMTVPDLANPMFQQVLHGLTRAAAADGYRVLVTDSQETLEEELPLVLEARRRSDAVVLCAPRMAADALAELLPRVQPAVVINRDLPEAAWVSVDYARGIRDLAEHLAGLGHRHLLHLAGPPTSSSQAARDRGLEQFRAAHPAVRVDRLVSGSTLDDGYAAGPAVRESGATGVLAFNDVVALGLLGRLREDGVAVPAEISVAGFDDVPVARFASPPLTTAAVPQAEMGEAAWLALRCALAGERMPGATVFTPALVARGSTASPGAGSSRRRH
jgi:LacI family transcriptional regulator